MSHLAHAKRYGRSGHIARLEQPDTSGTGLGVMVLDGAEEDLGRVTPQVAEH
jgi:hypothetical protein